MVPEIAEMSRIESDRHRAFCAEEGAEVLVVAVQYPESLPARIAEYACAALEAAGAHPTWRSYYNGQWHYFGERYS